MEPSVCYPRGPTDPIGTDGLIELDQECWVALAKYNLLLATLFGVLAVAARTTQPGNTLLVVENGALALSQSLNAVGLPDLIVSLFADSTGSFHVAVLLLFAVFILTGAVMETTPNILLLAPLLFPVAQEIGMSPVHFAVFLNSALGVGFITPPFGMNLYVMSGVTDESVLPIAKQVVPFLVVLMGLVLVIGFVPEISTVFTGA